MKLRYLNDVVDCYNTIGIVHCNRGGQEKGLPYFKKAELLYETVAEVENIPSIQYCNDQDHFLLRTTSENTNKGAPDAQAFTFFINGGLDKPRLETQYTLTIFYLG